MTHDCAIGWLSDFAEGTLDSKLVRQVREHIGHCSDCAAWLEWYVHISQAQDCSKAAPSELIAAYTVSPERVSQEDEEALHAHLKACTSCEDAFRLTSSAVASARQVPKESLVEAHSAARGRVSWRVAVAATLLLFTLCSLAIFFTRRPYDADHVVRNETIRGDRLLEGQGRIVIIGTEVRDGANLTVHAGGVVVFGSGFSVGSNVSMTVASDRRGRERNSWLDPSAKDSKGDHNGQTL